MIAMQGRISSWAYDQKKIIIGMLLNTSMPEIEPQRKVGRASVEIWPS